MKSLLCVLTTYRRSDRRWFLLALGSYSWQARSPTLKFDLLSLVPRGKHSIFIRGGESRFMNTLAKVSVKFECQRECQIAKR